jgi:hypothetical protein
LAQARPEVLTRGGVATKSLQSETANFAKLSDPSDGRDKANISDFIDTSGSANSLSLVEGVAAEKKATQLGFGLAGQGDGNGMAPAQGLFQAPVSPDSGGGGIGGGGGGGGAQGRRPTVLSRRFSPAVQAGADFGSIQDPFVPEKSEAAAAERQPLYRRQLGQSLDNGRKDEFRLGNGNAADSVPLNFSYSAGRVAADSGLAGPGAVVTVDPLTGLRVQVPTSGPRPASTAPSPQPSPTLPGLSVSPRPARSLSVNPLDTAMVLDDLEVDAKAKAGATAALRESTFGDPFESESLARLGSGLDRDTVRDNQQRQSGNQQEELLSKRSRTLELAQIADRLAEVAAPAAPPIVAAGKEVNGALATSTLPGEAKEPLRENLDAIRLLQEPALPPAQPAAEPAPAPAAPLPETLTALNPFSTFSLNVSDVSFKLAASSLANGAMPESVSIRSEEFVNAMDYHDPAPAPGSNLALAWEQAQNAFEHRRDLLRFSIQTAAIGREAGRPLNLVVLLDNSGSMERADRVREC